MILICFFVLGSKLDLLGSLCTPTLAVPAKNLYNDPIEPSCQHLGKRGGYCCELAPVRINLYLMQKKTGRELLLILIKVTILMISRLKGTQSEKIVN